MYRGLVWGLLLAARLSGIPHSLKLRCVGSLEVGRVCRSMRFGSS